VQPKERHERKATRDSRFNDFSDPETERAGVGIRPDVARQFGGVGQQYRGLVQRNQRSVRDVAHARVVGAQADQILCAGGCDQHDGAVKQGRPIGAVGQTFHGGAHGQFEFDTVPVPPLTPDLA
jgi:hypothetical protein